MLKKKSRASATISFQFPLLYGRLNQRDNMGSFTLYATIIIHVPANLFAILVGFAFISIPALAWTPSYTTPFANMLT